MNAISPSLSQSLARLSQPVPDDGEGGSDICRSALGDSGSRPDYIAAIEAAMNAPVRRIEPAQGAPDNGNSSALVARLQARRAPSLVPKPSPPASAPRAPDPSAFGLGPITVTLPPQRAAAKPNLPAPVQSQPTLSAAERLLLTLTAADTFIFTR